MAIDRTQRAVFDTTAELYAQARPSYPAELVNDVLQLSAIPAEGRILEIGCGPGNATLLFAQRGHHLLAVELGERLTALAAARCRDYPRVSVRQYILFPVQLLSLYGVTLDNVGQWLGRCFGSALIGVAVVTWLARKALPAEALQAILLGDFVIVATGLLTAVLDRLSIPSQERQCEPGRQATRTQVIQDVNLALQTYVGPAGLEYPIAALLAQATTRCLTLSDTRAAPP